MFEIRRPARGAGVRSITPIDARATEWPDHETVPRNPVLLLTSCCPSGPTEADMRGCAVRGGGPPISNRCAVDRTEDKRENESNPARWYPASKCNTDGLSPAGWAYHLDKFPTISLLDKTSRKRNKLEGRDLQLVIAGSVSIALNAFLWSRHDLTDRELFYISAPSFAALFWHVMR
jgi:hypothetical protein